MKENFEGELYLGGFAPPEISTFKDLGDEESASFDLLEAETHGDSVIERVLFKYKDPTSPPHTKKECCKWAKPWHGAKICVGWTIRKKWLYRIGYVELKTMSGTEGKKALEDCLKQSAIAAIIAGIASGGTAAIAAAETALIACLTSKLHDKFISVSVKIKSSRGGWE